MIVFQRPALLILAFGLLLFPSVVLGQEELAEDPCQIVQASTGLQAHNPGQGWQVEFDGLGFVVKPAGGGWSWGLQLESVGFSAAGCVGPEPERVSFEGQRVAYDWSPGVQEWYLNESMGLEHGYTILERPIACAPGPLIVDLAVRGSLSPRVKSGALGVDFVNRSGATLVTYAGLCVFDAGGSILDAHFSGGPDHLQIVIQESGANYPLTIDPIAQQAYLKASNAEASDRFGGSMAAFGDKVIIGAHLEASGSGIVNQGEADNSAYGAGAAYVFDGANGTWRQEAYLKAATSAAADYFGYSVAASGDVVVVGAPGEDSDATGVNGVGYHYGAIRSGAAYIFRRSGGGWVQEAYLKASNTDPGDRFGNSVAISGNLVVVGASNEASNSWGVNGDQSNNYRRYSGAVYVFERAGGAWTQVAYLKASNAGASDNFGSSLAISGNYLVVGAQGEASGGRGTNADPWDDSALNSGAVYVFKRSTDQWVEDAYLKASNSTAQTFFGAAVDIFGNNIIVGARGENSGSTGVNGQQEGNVSVASYGSGAAYLFANWGQGWVQEAYLKASNSDQQDGFGIDVTISNEMAAVGAWNEDGTELGLDGHPDSQGVEVSGACYTFKRIGGNWFEGDYVKASNVESGDSFGASLDLEGRTLFVGAYEEDSSAPGIGGDQTDNSALKAGAAYVFDLEASVGVYCSSGVGGTQGRLITAGSNAVMSNSLSLRVSGLPPLQLGYFLNSTGHEIMANTVGSQGNLCLGGSPVGRHNRPHELGFADATGRLGLAIDLLDMPTPAGSVSVTAGETWNFQCWYRDIPPGNVSSFTNAVSVLFE